MPPLPWKSHRRCGSQSSITNWLTERLRRCGLRSIDPVVDVTNYVLIELGQPMHAFDLDRLDSGITVRMAQEAILVLLDGQEVTLDPATLVIADASGPAAMAGVMGGKNSGVQSDSTNIFLMRFLCPGRDCRHCSTIRHTCVTPLRTWRGLSAAGGGNGARQNFCWPLSAVNWPDDGDSRSTVNANSASKRPASGNSTACSVSQPMWPK